MRSRHALETDLRSAIWRDEFELHYQTLIHSATREVCGVEALVRWRHPRRGLLGPDRFIAVAEETGLIVPLGEWILRRACTDAADWPAHIKLAVNLSAAQFTAPSLKETVALTLAADRAGAAAARARDHRVGAARERRIQSRRAACAARSRRLDRARRFRHRLFVAQLSAEIPVRQDQDRPLVRARAVEPQRQRGDRPRRQRARQDAQHPDDRRGDRDRRAIRAAARDRLSTRCRATCSAVRCRRRRSASWPRAAESAEAAA